LVELAYSTGDIAVSDFIAWGSWWRRWWGCRRRGRRTWMMRGIKWGGRR